jgi:hypothetical protein
MYRYGRALGYADGRLSNNGVGEIIAAAHLQLEHRRAQHGADAHDRDGRTVELKISEICDDDDDGGDADGGGGVPRSKRSWNYELPRQRKRGELKAAYVARVREHYERIAAGGHYLVVVRHCTVECSYRVDGEYMAALLAEYARDGRESVNFGSVACRVCRRHHRVLELQRDAERYAQATSQERAAWPWRALMSRRVESQCRQKK